MLNNKHIGGFDCLWLNGENLMPQSYRERRAKLDAAVRWKAHSMELIESTMITDGTPGVAQKLDDAMALNYEGVMFKPLNSTYVPGTRDDEWLKLKPDYVDGMGDELDLLMIGGYYGQGRRGGGKISHYLMGIKVREPARGLALPPRAGIRPRAYALTQPRHLPSGPCRLHSRPVSPLHLLARRPSRRKQSIRMRSTRASTRSAR